MIDPLFGSVLLGLNIIGNFPDSVLDVEGLTFVFQVEMSADEADDNDGRYHNTYDQDGAHILIGGFDHNLFGQDCLRATIFDYHLLGVGVDFLFLVNGHIIQHC